MARWWCLGVAAAGLLATLGGCKQPTNPEAWAKSQAMIAQAIKPQRLSWKFDGGGMGTLPPGFEPVAGLWGAMQGLEPVSPPKVLQQRSTSEPMAVLLLGDRVLTDARMRVHVKFMGGHKQAAGGLLFRYVDGGDYYLARIGAVGGRAQLGYAARGERVYLAGVSVDGLARGTWHEVVVEALRNRITMHVNGHQVLEVSDDQYPAGRVGLWTDEDTVASFDDLVIEAL